jgi:hypothetical protein|tara:strand:- start:7721 stop:7891 length:171 start_codon:yes stop_codon:yes gene_type:complete
MADLVFQAILSMLVAALAYIYFLNKTVMPPNKSIFQISDYSNFDTIYQDPPPPSRE